jgi:hypothetical protein
MANKKLQSGLSLQGIAPNILINHVENTAPFIFKGEVETSGKERSYLAKLTFYKKNLKALQKINLAEYFSLCMSAHWATAGTFVPTNVDNQIREGLWRHGEIGSYIEIMAKITMDSWKWDYNEVTNRKTFNPKKNQVMSTHEGTWLSVAIGAYCALKMHGRPALAKEMQEIILAEVKKEEELLLYLKETDDDLNFLRATALMAHNFGDLDRVMDQWEMDPSDSFFQLIYKLGHKKNPHYSPIFVFAGEINKSLMAIENHRHMSMRAVKALRQSKDFLIPIGPFMDDWGKTLGDSKLLSLEEKAQVVLAYQEGHTRQDMALGYARALNGLLSKLENGIDTLERYIPVDRMVELKKSKLWQYAHENQEEFEYNFIKRFKNYTSQES